MSTHAQPADVFERKKQLAHLIRAKRREVFEWYLEHARQAPPPFYCSVDLRDSGYKIVPVDSNLYPAGFNNICPDDLRTAPSVVRAQLSTISQRLKLPEIKRVLILPEAHTTNGYYLENLHYLSQILRDAGLEVQVGWYGPMPEGRVAPLKLLSATEKEIIAYPIEILGGVASAGGFVPDLILLNNDFSSGYPEPLDQITQPIFPSHALGWHSRKKSEHFVHYNRLAAEFAEIIGMTDPWMIQIDTEAVDEVNFNDDVGTDRVAAAAKRVLERTQTAYTARGIQVPPFAFVKNNSGTYGMGIMVVHSADELTQMNRRTKNKMSVGKGRLPIQSVCVQEGIPTATLVDRLAAEPVIYLVGTELIGGFLRTNTEKGIEENLNSQGMVFRKLCMSDLQRPLVDGGDGADAAETDEDEEEPVMELVYGSIARISALATGLEIAQHPPHSMPHSLPHSVPNAGV